MHINCRLRWWGRAAVVAVFGALLAGCGEKMLTGRPLGPDAEEVAAIQELLTRGADLSRAGDEPGLLGLIKKDLPKSAQASVTAKLRQVAGARSWEVSDVRRFTDNYFRATVQLQGADDSRQVTIAVLKQDGTLVFTGGG